MNWDNRSTSAEDDPVHVRGDTAYETRICLTCHQKFSAAKGEPKENEICPHCAEKRTRQENWRR